MIISRKKKNQLVSIILIFVIFSSSIFPIFYSSMKSLDKQEKDDDDLSSKISFDDVNLGDSITQDIEVPDVRDDYRGFEDIDPIGTNILILAEESYLELINNLFSNSIINPTLVFNKDEFILNLEERNFDIIFLLSLEENFTTNEIQLLEDYIESGRIIISTSNALDFNSNLKDLFGIEESTQVPEFLINSSIISEYYLVKEFLNDVIPSRGGGTLYVPKSTSLTLAQYGKWRPPLVQINNKTISKNFVSSGDEVEIVLTIKNLGWDTAKDIIIEEFLNGFTIISSNFQYLEINGTIKWYFESLKQNEDLTLKFNISAPTVIKSSIFTLKSNIIYSDVYRNNFQYPEVDLFNYLNLKITSPLTDIEVIPSKILAWCDDPSDEWFISEVFNNNSQFIKVNNIKDLMGNLTEDNIELLWLMNFGRIDFSNINKLYKEFGEYEASIIKDWVRNGGKIISSDWALKLHQKSLKDLYGIKNLGSSRLNIWECGKKGERDWYHKIFLSEDHPINNGLQNTSLKSKSWAFDIHLYSSCHKKKNLDLGNPEVVAYFSRSLGCSGKEILKDSPAIIASTFEKGKGVYFSNDIGMSAYTGYNTSAWVEIAKNALSWLLSRSINPVDPIPVEFVIPDSEIAPNWINEYINSQLPSISISSFGKGRSLFFSFRSEQLNNEIFCEIINKACYRMILLEDQEGFTMNSNTVSSKEFQILGRGDYILYVETENHDENEIITYLDGKEIKPFIMPLNWSSIPISLDQETIHTLKFEKNSSFTGVPDVNITHLSIQSPLLFYNNKKHENANSQEFYFRGGGYLAFITNSSGQDLNFILDGEDIRISNITEYAALRDYKYVKYGLHCLKINNSIGFNLSSIAVFFDNDLDGDGIEFFREFVYKTNPCIQDPWILWNSLSANFYLNNSIRNHYFNYTGEAILYIPSNFSEEALYWDLLSIDGKISNLRLDDEILMNSTTIPIKTVITSNVTEGFHKLDFQYQESHLGCRFHFKIQVKDRILKNIYDGDITDSDGDGLCDSNEILNGFHPFNPDIDGDFAFDGIDYAPTIYDEFSSDKPQNYSISINNKNFTTRITLQIKVPYPNYRRSDLLWNEGHVDIIPMIRVFGPQEYIENNRSYFGDSLPSKVITNNYIALIPLAQLSDESLLGVIFYEPFHPAFEDDKIDFMFDVVWVAIQTLDNGTIYPLHLWSHPNGIVIQALTKTEIGPVDLAFVPMTNPTIAKTYYDLIRIQMAPYNNYYLKLPSSIQNPEILVIKNVTYLNSSDILKEQIQSYKTRLQEIIQIGRDLEFYILTTLVQRMLLTPFSDIIGNISNNNVKQAIRMQVVKSDMLLHLFALVNGTIETEILKKPGFYNFYYNTETIKHEVRTDEIFSSESIQAIEFLGELTEEHIHYKIICSNIILTPNRIYNTTEVFHTNIYRKGENIIYWYFKYYEQSGKKVIMEAISLNEILSDYIIRGHIKGIVENKKSNNLKFLSMINVFFQKGIRSRITKFITIFTKTASWEKIVDWLSTHWNDWTDITGMRGLSNYLGLDDGVGFFQGAFYKGAMKFVKGVLFFISLFTNIRELALFTELALTASDGTPLLAKILLWTLVGAYVASIVVGVIDFGILMGGLASSAAASATTYIGLIIAAIIVVIMIILWFIRPAVVDYAILESEPFQPKVYFDKATNKTMNYKLSPETGAVVNVGFYLLNKGEAVMGYYYGRMKIGSSNPWGVWQNTLRVRTGRYEPIYPWEFGYLAITAQCVSWGAQLDALIHISYDFWNDWLVSPLFVYIPLDLNLNVFPKTIDEFLNELSEEKIVVKEAYAIHIVTSGELEYAKDGINLDYLNVYGSYEPSWESPEGEISLGPWFYLGTIDGDSDAKDAWVVGFKNKSLLQYIRLTYCNTPWTLAGESFELIALTVSYGGKTYESYNYDEYHAKPDPGPWTIGSEGWVSGSQAYKHAVFSSNPNSAMWLKEYSTEAPWYW